MANGCDRLTEPDTISDPTEDSDYELVWSDEFDQPEGELDSEKWGYDLGYGENGWGNDEWQNYTGSPENVRVEDGNLLISAIWDSVNYAEPGKRDGSVTSARVNTRDRFSFKYGKVQARIKPSVGMGAWPAFWMLGTSFDSAGWPYCGEIDIMEMSPLYHGDQTTMFTLHWWDDGDAEHRSYGTTREFSQSLGEDYHIFEVEWDEQRITGRIDDITYFVKVIEPDTMNEFLREFFIITNIAVGGNLGGSPDISTVWPLQMSIDWIRVYQREGLEDQITSFGIFTDETVVDDALEIGVNAEIYVWESTLTGGTIPPYEGSNVISWSSTGAGWFGGGISSNVPLDLSGFAEGYMKFMIKIPGNVSFKIGINDIAGNENYVEFPANQTMFGLVRNGDWGQAIIPVAEIRGNVDLAMLSYEFMILEEHGTQCQFALDDIFWDGGGITASSIVFDSASYTIDDSGASIILFDALAAETIAVIEIDNGAEAISVEINLDETGAGTGMINFGITDDNTDTIAIEAGGILTATYTDFNEAVLTATAGIEDGSTAGALGIYSETHTEQMLSYGLINSADWSGNSAVPDEMSTAVTPVDGSYVLSVDFEQGSHGWGGIAFDFGSQGQDITAYSTFVINIDSSSMAGFARLGLKFEDTNGGQTEINIADFTPVVNGNWSRYEIAMSSFSGVDLADVKYLGIWNPGSSSNVYLFGNLYFDDIHLLAR